MLPLSIVLILLGLVIWVTLSWILGFILILFGLVFLFAGPVRGRRYWL